MPPDAADVALGKVVLGGSADRGFGGASAHSRLGSAPPLLSGVETVCSAAPLDGARRQQRENWTSWGCPEGVQGIPRPVP